jgi:hypothetical protein
VTVPATTTTTICQRPPLLNTFSFANGYTIPPGSLVDFSDNLAEDCAAISTLSVFDDLGAYTLSEFTIQTQSLKVGQEVYFGTSSDCIYPADGWYLTQEGIYNGFVYHIEAGVIVSIDYCNIACPPGPITEKMLEDCGHCEGRIYEYSIPEVPEDSTSLTWTVPDGGTIISQGTTSIMVEYSNSSISGNVTVYSTNSAGRTSDISTFVVSLPECTTTTTTTLPVPPITTKTTTV